MGQEARTVGRRRGTAVIRYKAGVRIREVNERWFIHRLHDVGWPHQAIATHFGLSAERVDQIVAGAGDDAMTYIATLLSGYRPPPG